MDTNEIFEAVLAPLYGEDGTLTLEGISVAQHFGAENTEELERLWIELRKLIAAE